MRSPTAFVCLALLLVGCSDEGNPESTNATVSGPTGQGGSGVAGATGGGGGEGVASSVGGATTTSMGGASVDTTSTTSSGASGTGAAGGAGGSQGGAASAEGGAGGTTDGGMGGNPLGDQPAPELLSETGLYESDMTTLGPGVRFFQPAYQLWTDAAVKRRWMRLPEGQTIDTQNMDFWSYPVGTQLWKEFSRDGVRVETRLIQKQPSGEWTMMAYHWREDQMEADAVPDGVQNASGTSHDIPSTEQCEECHLKLPDKAIGFSAFQLSHDPVGDGAPEWTLDSLASEGLLSDPPEAPLALPGTATDQAAFGYLHANCGHCHNRRTSVGIRINMFLWLTQESLSGTVEETDSYASTVARDTTSPDGPPEQTVRVVPQQPSESAIILRMMSRGEDASMPPLGTEDPDAEGIAAVEAWINALVVE